MRATFIFFSLIVLSPVWAQDGTPVLPKEWRFPTAHELSEEKLRKNSKTKYAKATADFNGDGIRDQAFLVKSTKFNGEGLVLWLSERPGKFRWVVLAAIDWGTKIDWGAKSRNAPLVMGIETVKPGVYEYYCIVKGNECIGKEEGRSKITLLRPALVHFKFESASSAFYWDSEIRQFITIVISD